MLVVRWIRWWYGTGWLNAATAVRAQLKRIYLTFSVPLLLQTLVAPWRRIISSQRGNLSQRLRAVVDNAVSRCVGFAVRLIALLAAVLLLLFTSVIGGLILLFWPLMPPVGLLCIGLGVVS